MKQEIKEIIEKINTGEVPKGYKKTEFGVFPSDWCTDKTFRDLFEFYGGLGKSRDELSNKGIEYLHYGDLHRNDRNIVTYEEYSMLPKYSINLKGDETFLMKDGDIAFLDASEDLEGTSRAVLIDNPDNKPFIAGLHIIFAKSKRDFLSKYFRQYITIPSYVKKQFYCLSCGFKVYGINRNSLTKIKYVYPVNREEQEKIAEILMKWDKAIELQESLIEKVANKQNAIVLKILDPNKNFQRVSLGDILIERSVRTKENNQHIVLSSTKQGLFTQCDFFEKQIASENNIGYKVLKINQIVLSPQNLWLGNINYNDKFEVGIVSPSYKIFDINEKYNKLYIATMLQTPRLLNCYAQSSEQGASVVRRNLNMDLFYDIQLNLPNKNEQDKRAKIIKRYKNLLDLEIKKLNALKQQRKTLQQYLLNGIVRVKI